MIRLGPLICRGYMKEWLFKIVVLLWTVFLWVFLVCGFFSPQGQELLCESWMSLCSGSLCCAKLCLEGWGAMNTYLLPKELGNLFFIPIFVRIASGIHTVVWVSGVPSNVASAAVLGMLVSFWLGVHLCPSPLFFTVFYPCPKHLFCVSSFTLLFSSLYIKLVYYRVIFLLILLYYFLLKC